jgi:hypothetical protein
VRVWFVRLWFVRLWFVRLWFVRLWFVRLWFVRLMFVRAAAVETPVAGVLATIAFLVVFRVLIKDFFWMVTVCSSCGFFDLFYCSLPLLHGPCQIRGSDGRNL